MSDIPSNLSKWEPPRIVKITFLAFAVACVVALAFAKVYSATVVEHRRIEEALQVDKVSGPAPAFALKDRQGHEVHLADYRGKVVFLNFWASWCGPCREEMPSLEQLAGEVDGRDAVFLAVSVDDGWQPVDQFLAGKAPPFTVLLDEGQKVSDTYGTHQYPESYIIGPDGKLRYKVVGARDWSSMAALKLLEQAGARPALSARS